MLDTPAQMALLVSLTIVAVLLNRWLDSRTDPEEEEREGDEESHLSGSVEHDSR